MLLNDPEMQILNNLTGFISRSCRYFRCFEMVEQNYTLSCEEEGREGSLGLVLFYFACSNMFYLHWYSDIGIWYCRGV